MSAGVERRAPRAAGGGRRGGTILRDGRRAASRRGAVVERLEVSGGRWAEAVGRLVAGSSRRAACVTFPPCGRPIAVAVGGGA